MEKIVELSSDVTVLIVDEAGTVRDALAGFLHVLGYKKILQATDHPTAMKLLHSQNVGLIICERNLRVFSGMELLHEIRESMDLARCPFIMMAQNVYRDDVVLGAEFGIDGYLKKPFLLKDVSRQITGCMERYLTPGTAEAMFERARQLFEKNNFEEALAVYSGIEMLLPKSARLHVGLGRCLRGLKDHKGALEHLEQAIMFNAMYIHAWHELGLLYLEMGKLKKSLEAFDKGIELSPLNPLRYESVSEILMGQQKYAEAEKYLARAVKLELAQPELFAMLGQCYFALGQTDNASKWLKEAVRSQPDNISFLNSLGICMKDQGRFEEAISYYNQALKMRAHDTKILFNKALCLISMNENEKAIKSLEQILKYDSTYTKAKLKIEEIHRANPETRKTG